MFKLNKMVKGLALAGALATAGSAWALAPAAGGAPAAAPAAAPADAASGASSTAGLSAPAVQVASPFSVSGPQNAQPVLGNGMEPKLREAAELNGDIQILTLQAKKKELQDKIAGRGPNGQGGANGQGGVPGQAGGGNDSTLGGAQAVLAQLRAQKEKDDAEKAHQVQVQRVAAAQRAAMVAVTNTYGVGNRWLADMIVGGDAHVTAGVGTMLPNGQIVKDIGINGVLLQVPGPGKSSRMLIVPVAGAPIAAGSFTPPAAAQAQQHAAREPNLPKGPIDSFPPVITGPGVDKPVLIPDDLRATVAELAKTGQKLGPATAAPAPAGD
jgi:hypothetical protein